MDLDGAYRNDQPVRDFFIGHSFGDELKDLALPVG
jgi:hypothetical protein